jgi:hypothetical protein
MQLLLVNPVLFHITATTIVCSLTAYGPLPDEMHKNHGVHITLGRFNDGPLPTLHDSLVIAVILLLGSLLPILGSSHDEQTHPRAKQCSRRRLVIAYGSYSINMHLRWGQWYLHEYTSPLKENLVGLDATSCDRPDIRNGSKTSCSFPRLLRPLASIVAVFRWV